VSNNDSDAQHDAALPSNGEVDDNDADTANHEQRAPIPININSQTINAYIPGTEPTDPDADDDEGQTIIINGKAVQMPDSLKLPKRRRTKNQRGSKMRSVNGRREFIIEGFKTKTKIGRRSKTLPELDLLNYTELQLPSNEEVNHRARLIENTMLEFDIDADVIDVRVGPTITQYAVSPIKEVIDEDGERHIIRTRVNKIAGLANDLALALSTKTLRIEAPVPGHSYVGIEVPNAEPSTVSLRAMLESEEYYNERKKPLAVPLGRDVSGNPVVIDLAAMPHILMAGTTGSGKSVGLRSMLTALVMSNTPDTMRLIVLDPKRVEFTQFNGLPHLIGPVETDPERIIGVLRWATREMDRRYRLLEQEKARNIEAYNAILGRRRKSEHMPYVVIVVDEIGDLMMIRPEETERTLTRLAQKARAAGMHMVVATQRPSVDVITGLIKANFPARISYAVASSTDSRVILDYTGADALIGRGDMLFLGPDAAGPTRLQGAFADDDEIDRVVNYWHEWQQQQIEDGKLEAPGTPPWEQAVTRLESLTDVDPLLEEAVDLVVSEGRASASLIQRKLGVGYPRAAQLIDSLHELSIVGSPKAGGKTREVLVKSVNDARRMMRNNRRKQRY
jgi:DNA segregation ATPase FtsK/SpoIIIE, S-DNA-T family